MNSDTIFPKNLLRPRRKCEVKSFWVSRYQVIYFLNISSAVLDKLIADGAIREIKGNGWTRYLTSEVINALQSKEEASHG